MVRPGGLSDREPIHPANQKQLQGDANQEVNRSGGVSAKINPLPGGVNVGGQNQEQENTQRPADVPRQRGEENGHDRKQLEDPAEIYQREAPGHPGWKHLGDSLPS